MQAFATARVCCVLGVVLSWATDGRCATQKDGDSRPGASDQIKFTPPPGEETAAVTALIDRAEAALKSGKTATDLLTDPDYLPAHAWPRFRGLIRESATAHRTKLVTGKEPGTPLVVSGTVKDRNGRPVEGARLYVYHTSDKGWYSDKAAHIAAHEGDRKHARLFAYLTTGPGGAFEFRTIRPAGYPHSDLPAHIHIEITPRGVRPDTLATEIRFEDDPRLTEKMREQSLREGFLICPVKRDAEGVLRVTAELKLR